MKYFKITLAMLLVAVICSCSKDNGYTRVIPQDAEAVAEININGIVEKAGQADNDSVKMIAKGVDLAEPAYAFTIGKDKYAAVMKMKDADALKQILTELSKDGKSCTEPKKQDDLWTGKIEGDVNYGFNDELLILLSNQGLKEPAKRTFAKLLENEKSFADTPEFGKLAEEKGDVKAYAKFDAVSVNGGINFEDGRTIIFADITPGEKADKDETLGQTLLNVVKSFPQASMFLGIIEMQVDVMGLLRSMDGEILIGLESQDLKSVEKFFLTAHLADESIKDQIPTWQNALAEANIPGVDMKIENSKFYVGNSPAWDNEGKKDITIELRTAEKVNILKKLVEEAKK